MQTGTIIDRTYSDPIHGLLHVVVASNTGGGNKYIVYINNYVRGSVVQYYTEWKAFINTPELSQDDIDAIMDAIEEADA